MLSAVWERCVNGGLRVSCHRWIGSCVETVGLQPFSDGFVEAMCRRWLGSCSNREMTEMHSLRSRKGVPVVLE